MKRGAVHHVTERALLRSNHAFVIEGQGAVAFVRAPKPFFDPLDELY